MGHVAGEHGGTGRTAATGSSKDRRATRGQDQRRKAWTVVHGDDFVSEGPIESLKKMDAMLSKHFDIKTEILGPAPGCVQQ